MTHTLWTNSAEAQELLAEAAANGVPTRQKRDRDLDTCFTGYTGPVFAKLRGIRERALEAIFFTEGGSDNFFANADLSVDSAIDQAISAARLGVAA